MIPTNNPMLATLFGAKAIHANPHHGIQPDTRSASEAPGGNAPGSGAEPAWKREMRENVEAGRKRGAETTAELPKIKEEARRKHVADLERGYSIRANDRLRNSQASALRSPAGEASFPSRERAMDIASMIAGRSTSAINTIHWNHDLIAQSQERLSDPERWMSTEKELTARIARSKDTIKAERMMLDVQAGNMRMMFGVTEPTFNEAADGTLSYTAYEVRHSKYGLLVSVDENGTMTKYGPDGEPEVPMGQRLDRSV